MRVSVSDADGSPIEVVKRAEARDEVILTHQGRDAARLVPRRSGPRRQRPARIDGEGPGRFGDQGRVGPGRRAQPGLSI